MSYISAITTQSPSTGANAVLVWERTPEGRFTKTFKCPYYFYEKSKAGEYRSIYGDPLKKYTFDNASDFRIAKRTRLNNTKLFESDIPFELKVLSKHYYNVPAPALHVSFYDIEVDYDKNIGFSSVSDPYAPVNSIALYHAWKNKYTIIAVPPETWTGNEQDLEAECDSKLALPIDSDYEFILCENERELLVTFLEEIQDSDIISGWNSDFFDTPYLGKRLERLGKRYFKQLSFPDGKLPRFGEARTKHGTIQTTLELSGRESVDYLVLFRKYEMAERASYKLETIADEILPELPKLKYDGSLADLYVKDFAWFIRYNFRDTEILKGFEDRLGYVELANQMCHLSTGLFKHVTGTLKLAELAMINFCHHELDHLIVHDLTIPSENYRIQGACVLLPQIGLHEWIGSVDINSLYPASIRSINISPETLIGQFTTNIDAVNDISNNNNNELILEYDNGKIETASAEQWRIILNERKWAVSGYGTVFDQKTKGIIPSILENWYATRKKYQKLAIKAKDEGDTIRATYYDKLQYVYKIKLNSFYGALSNQYFRFYDARMGDSTTGTGRMILLHQCAEISKLLDGKYALPDRVETDKLNKKHYGYTTNHSIIYGDTDSSYFVTHATNEREATLIADHIGDLVNKSFPEFMRKTFLCQPEYDNIIKTGREIISDRGIFVDKKRYILHLVNDDGYPVDKIKVMGLDTKRTTLPKKVSNKLNHFIERYLKGEEWESIEQNIVDYKDELLQSTNIMDIGLPKGVNNVEQYTSKLEQDPDTNLPGHVAASIFYNRCLKTYSDTESPVITSGTKIQVFYLTRKNGRFKSIAFPTDIERIPEWFFNNFEIDKTAHLQRLVDNPLNNILKAINKETPSKQSLLNQNLLCF